MRFRVKYTLVWATLVSVFILKVLVGSRAVRVSNLSVAFLRVLDAVDSCRSIFHKGGDSMIINGMYHIGSRLSRCCAYFHLL